MPIVSHVSIGVRYYNLGVATVETYRNQNIRLISVRRSRDDELEGRRVNVDFPQWMVESLEKDAHRLGVTRQSLIKLWIADKLDRHP